MTVQNAGGICHTCGATVNLELVATCDKCKEVSSHVYCMNVLLDEVPEQWYCEECTDYGQASNNPNRNSALQDKLSLKREKLESVLLTKAHASSETPPTGKVKFIPQREITLLDDRKHFSKMSPAQEKTPKKLRCLTEIMGLPHHNKKKEVITKHMDKKTRQKNRELQPEKERIINLPVSEVIWKGVINYFHVVSQTHGVQVHLAEKASQKIKEILKEMPQMISMKMKPRLEFRWEAFKLQPPSQQDIGLYFFSSESDRSKDKFHRMVKRLHTSDHVLAARIGSLALFLFPSQILPECNQCINGECYLWGLIHRYERKVSNQVPVTVCTTSSVKRENHDRSIGGSQIKSNEMDVDMEIDMIGGVELSSTLRANFTSQPNPTTPPGFHSNHFESNNTRNHYCLKSDMGRVLTSTESQLSCSELHSAVKMTTTLCPMNLENFRCSGV